MGHYIGRLLVFDDAEPDKFGGPMMAPNRQAGPFRCGILIVHILAPITAVDIDCAQFVIQELHSSTLQLSFNRPHVPILHGHAQSRCDSPSSSACPSCQSLCVPCRLLPRRALGKTLEVSESWHGTLSPISAAF